MILPSAPLESRKLRRSLHVKYTRVSYSGSMVAAMSLRDRVDCMARSDDVIADLASDLVPKITCQVVSPGLISRLWLRTPC